MRILLVHNFYRSSNPSGENRVFEAEKRMLERRGHHVEEFTRHSDAIEEQGVWGAARGGASTPWNPFAVRALRRKVNDIQPDVVHVHNTFPLISPSIFHGLDRLVPRVFGLPNYRLFCAAALAIRNENPCTECLDGATVWPAIKYKCYRTSRLATLPLAAGIALHRRLGTWQNHVDAFLALSEFQKEKMVAAGLPTDKTYVKPNFHPGSPAVLPWSEREETVVFVGRLSAEKGVESLLRAWKGWGSGAPRLRIIGDGPLRGDLQKMARGLPVQFTGQIPATEVEAEVGRACLVVLPSEWYETFGLAVLEGFARGTPAAVSNIGPLPSLVEHGRNGLVFEPAKPDSLLSVVREAWETPGLLDRLGGGARATFETKYTEDQNYRMLMDIYRSAIRTRLQINGGQPKSSQDRDG